MNMEFLTNRVRERPVTLLCALALSSASLAANVDHSRNHDRVYTFRATPVTGINELCGKPVWTFDYPAPFPSDFHTPTFGAYDPRPGATESIPLTAANCKPDTLAATIVDPLFAAYLNVGPHDIDPRLLNLPLRDVPEPIEYQSVRAPLPSLAAINPATSTVARFKSEPSFPITLREWFKARGHLTIHCTNKGHATAAATFTHLVPNGLYSVWGSWTTPPAPGAPAAVVPIPFGGAPNTLIADHEGSATFQRDFAACPLDTVPDAAHSKLHFVALVYHSDGVLYGASPGPFQDHLHFQAKDGSLYDSFAIPGILIQDHLIFPTGAGTRIDNGSLAVDAATEGNEVGNDNARPDENISE
jgi:hypothetical protein